MQVLLAYFHIHALHSRLSVAVDMSVTGIWLQEYRQQEQPAIEPHISCQLRVLASDLTSSGGGVEKDAFGSARPVSTAEQSVVSTSLLQVRLKTRTPCFCTP